jgi:hypothetical protein
MKPTIEDYQSTRDGKAIKVTFPGILNQNSQPVTCIVIVEEDNGAPTIEIVQSFQEDGQRNLVRQNVRVDVQSKEVNDLRDQLDAEIKEITYLKAKLAEAKELIARLTAPPAELSYSELTEVAMIQANGEINGWDRISYEDAGLYATCKARAETNPEYLAILNSCRIQYRADKEADEMRARCEKLMDEMTANMTLDEMIALDLLDQDAHVDAAAAEWETRVARGEVEADEMAARHEEEIGSAF